MATRTPNWSPYRYALDNPLRLFDPDGRTEKERLKMVKAAEDLKGQKRGAVMKGKGLVGNKKMDCGVVIRISALAAGLKDPALGDKYKVNDNSVGRIAEKGRETSVADARFGDVVVFNTGKADFNHVGLITEILSVGESGKVTDFRFVHCSGRNDKGKVKESTLSEVTGWTTGKYKVNGVFQLDTPDTSPGHATTAPQEPSGLGSNSQAQSQ